MSKIAAFLQSIPESARAQLYRVSLAVMALLVGYGFIEQGDAPLWLMLLAAIFGVGAPALASANTSRKPVPLDPPEFP
jgi:hypothetical protein